MKPRAKICFISSMVVHVAVQHVLCAHQPTRIWVARTLTPESWTSARRISNGAEGKRLLETMNRSTRRLRTQRKRPLRLSQVRMEELHRGKVFLRQWVRKVSPMMRLVFFKAS